MVDPNPLRSELDAGNPIFGGDARTFSPTVIETFGEVGLDYAWLDFEHSGPSPWDSRTTETYCRTAAAADTELVVRVPTNEPKLIGKVLDAGVRTIVLPQIETAEEVDRAIRSARFGGREGRSGRGIGPGRSSRWGYDADGDLDGRNDEVLVGAMIETRLAVENVRDILSVPNLGFIFVGPSDLSVSMTGRLERDADQVTRAIEAAVAAAADADVPVGRSFPSVDAAETALENGYQMITLGRDVSAVFSTFETRLDALR